MFLCTMYSFPVDDDVMIYLQDVSDVLIAVKKQMRRQKTSVFLHFSVLEILSYSLSLALSVSVCLALSICYLLSFSLFSDYSYIDLFLTTADTFSLCCHTPSLSFPCILSF